MADRSRPRATLARAVSAVTATAGVSKLVMLGAEVVLARTLGVDGFGSYAVASSLVIVISSIAVVGMDNGVVQLMTRPGSLMGERRIVGVALMVAGGVAAVTGAVVAVAAAPLASALLGEGGSATVLRIAAIAVVFETVNNILAAALRVHHRYALSIGVFDGARNISLGIGVVAALGAASPTWAMAWFAGGSAVGTVVGLVALRTCTGASAPTHLDRPKTAAELWSFSRSLSVWGVLQLSSTQLYVVVAGLILLPREVSALAIGLRVVVLLNFLRTSLAASIQRELAVLSHDGRLARMQQVLTTASMSLLVASGLLCIPFLIGPSTVMRAFGAEWVPYAWIIWPLLVPKLINVSAGPVGQALIATGNGPRLLKLAVGEMVLQLVILLPAMIAFGLAGAVVGEAIRVGVMIAARHITLARAVGIRSFTPNHVVALGVFAVAIAIGAAVYAGVGHLVGYALGIIVAAVAAEALMRIVVQPPSSPVSLGLRFAGLASGPRPNRNEQQCDR